jgi:hypothetical protein
MDSKACQKTEQGMRLQRLENLINGNEKSTQANILSAFIGFIPTKKVENVGNIPGLQIQGIEIYLQVRIDLDRNGILERIGFDTEICLLQMVNQDPLPGRVHNPVFPDTCISVKVQLHHIIVTGIARGNDFNDPVWGSGTAPVSEFVPVTDHAYVWLDNGFTVFSQLDSEGSGEHTTGTAFATDIVPDRSGKLHEYCLVDSGGGGLVIDQRPIDQLCPDIFRQIVIVSFSVKFALC